MNAQDRAQTDKHIDPRWLRNSYRLLGANQYCMATKVLNTIFVVQVKRKKKEKGFGKHPHEE